MKFSGDDTECIVTILDDDRPGNIGFRERSINVRRKDQVAYVYLDRQDGCDGEISCSLNTSNTLEILNSNGRAVEYKDFVPIEQIVEF